MGQFDKEASRARDDCGAKNAPHRAARPDSSLRKERLFGMTIKLTHHCSSMDSGTEIPSSAGRPYTPPRIPPIAFFFAQGFARMSDQDQRDSQHSAPFSDGYSASDRSHQHSRIDGVPHILVWSGADELMIVLEHNSRAPILPEADPRPDRKRSA